MPGTIAPPVVNFEQDIVRLVMGTKLLLKNSKERTEFAIELNQTTPSLVASKACDVHEVVVKVRRGNDLWSPQLENAVRDEVAAHKSPNMAPVRLKVERY